MSLYLKDKEEEGRSLSLSDKGTEGRKKYPHT